MAKSTAAKNASRGSVHPTHEAEQRSNEPVHEMEDEPWQRGASLDMPPARPGMDQRWIRFMIGGKEDQTNFARKQREGWVPRAADSVPKTFMVPRMEQGRFAGMVVVEGNILCERAKSIGERRTKHFRNETARRTEAVNADLQRVNKANASPAFGPIRMAMESKVMRERAVAVQDDE